ncbi:MAG TPA: DNA primase, partial [Cyanobacteria bacterium UBA8543]|nr:DNA primase [Cyanobacteria bacterium UBA8543]
SCDDIAQAEIFNPAMLATDNPYLQTKNSLKITDSVSPLFSCVDDTPSTQSVDTQEHSLLPGASVSTVSQGEEPDENINHPGATQVQFIVFPVAQRQESKNSHSADTEVSLGWKAVLNIAAPQQNLAISDSPASGQHSTERQIQVTLEELNSSPELHPKQQISFVTTMSLELASEQKDPGKLTNTGISTLPLIALVVSAIQKYYSSKVSRTGDLPKSPEAGESPVTAEPQVTEIGAEVDPFPESMKPSYSTDDSNSEALANSRASALSSLRESILRRTSLEKPQQDASHIFCANCFVSCENLGTLAVMWMEASTPSSSYFHEDRTVE